MSAKWQLVSHARIAVRERDVARDARRNGKRQADELRAHRIEAGRLGIETHELGTLDLAQPPLERGFVGHGFVVSRHRRGRIGGGRRRARIGMVERPRIRSSGAIGLRQRHFTCPDVAGFLFDRLLRAFARRFANSRGTSAAGSRIAPGAIAKPLLEFEALVKRFQTFFVGRPQREVGGSLRERAIGLHGEETLALRKPFERGPQIFADYAGNLAGVSNHHVERAVLREPFRRRLGPHFRHARHVVHGIAGECEKIQHLVGANAEFREHSRFVERLVAHRVDELDPRTHELRQVLVGSRDHAVDSVRGRRDGERADHVVGLDAFDHQERPAVRANELVQRLDLPHEILRHHRALGLVLRIPVVAERLAGSVEHDGEVVGLLVFRYPAEHGHDTAQRTGRLAARGAQIGQVRGMRDTDMTTHPPERA